MLSTAKKPAGAPLPEDLEKLFEEHGRFVLGVAYRVTGNRAAAEDILQALFLRLLQSDRIGDLGSNPKGYLYRSAVNMSLDLIRRERSDDRSRRLRLTPRSPTQSLRRARHIRSA